MSTSFGFYLKNIECGCGKCLEQDDPWFMQHFQKNVTPLLTIVGNSVNLKRSHYGKLIDHHTSVIRMNLGKTEGFEQDVGSRTTHHVMYPESASDLDNSTHLVLFPFKIKDLEWLVGVMVLNPAFMKYVHQSWLRGKGDYPSTGFMTVILVSVFGFGADSDGNWSHYWEVLRNKNFKTGGHPGSVEYDMIVELAKREKLDFYRGW
uniref:Uncharacterized protein n=1 Tax=Neogobius melanostomus TaxID=47308 RepID=A0A8C6SFW6_9GOBI